VQSLVVAKMGAKLVPTTLSEKRRPVLVTLPSAHEHEALVEVDVLHPECAAL
jgi:hypothetical protein